MRVRKTNFAFWRGGSVDEFDDEVVDDPVPPSAFAGCLVLNEELTDGFDEGFSLSSSGGGFGELDDELDDEFDNKLSPAKEEVGLSNDVFVDEPDEEPVGDTIVVSSVFFAFWIGSMAGST